MNPIPPLSLNSLSKLPSSPPPPPPGEDKIAAKVVSFNAEAIDNANELIKSSDSDKVKDTLTFELIKAPPALSFGDKEGPLAADITKHLLPSLLNNPTQFPQDLLDSIKNKEAPKFLDELEDSSVLFSKESWKALLQDKPALKSVLAAIDKALTTADGAIPSVPPLLKPLIDEIGDDKSSAASPDLQRRSTSAKQTLLQKTGNALRTPLLIGSIALGTVELTGVTDFTPLGPNRGGTPPPAELVDGDAMKVITGLKGKDISNESQDTIQGRIVETLNKAAEISPEFSFDSKRLIAYYGNTLKSLKHENKVIGAIIQANVKATESSDGKPHAILYQQANTKVQITFVPIKEARAETLMQDGDSVVLTIPASDSNPTVITKQGNLNSLINGN